MKEDAKIFWFLVGFGIWPWLFLVYMCATK